MTERDVLLAVRYGVPLLIVGGSVLLLVDSAN